jgi:glycosyltransferase involved in cell wall biosynthesis
MKTRMRIAIFTNNYLPNPYGVSGSIESFCKGFEQMGHTVYIFAPYWSDYVDKNPNVFRYPSLDVKIRFRFPLPLSYSQKMDKIIENLNLDIVHCQHPNLLGSAGYGWARKKNIPVVFTWHTLYDKYTNFVPFVPKKLAAWWVIREAVRFANKADKVIVPTKSVEKIIKNWGVTNENIEAVLTGVEEKDFEGSNGEVVRKKYQIKENEIVSLSASRLTEEKNVQFLFEAILDVLKDNKNVKFLHVGGGYLQNELEKFAKEKKIEKQIIFAGEVKREEMKNYYASADIFVYASKSETQGMIISEAMYSGLPVVAVNATGICDLVIDGKTGLLVLENKDEFAGAVINLIEDENKRKLFGENSKKVAMENYTSKVCAKKMLELYERVKTKK